MHLINNWCSTSAHSSLSQPVADEILLNSSRIFQIHSTQTRMAATTSTNLNSKGIPSIPATEQGGNQVELPTIDLPIRAIQAVEELAKVLKQFCTSTSGKEHFHHISSPCITAKQFLFLLWEQLPTPLPLCLLQFCHKTPTTPPPTCPYQGIQDRPLQKECHFIHWLH